MESGSMGQGGSRRSWKGGGRSGPGGGSHGARSHGSMTSMGGGAVRGGGGGWGWGWSRGQKQDQHWQPCRSRDEEWRSHGPMTSMAGCVGGLGMGGIMRSGKGGWAGGGVRGWVGAEKPHAGAVDHEMGPWVHEGHGRRGRVREG